MADLFAGFASKRLPGWTDDAVYASVWSDNWVGMVAEPLAGDRGVVEWDDGSAKIW